MRETDGTWRAIDATIEGISLVLSYRDQFKLILSRDGPDGLLEGLRKKNAEPRIVGSWAPRPAGLGACVATD